MNIISETDARKAGMVPLTVPMDRDSPELAQVIADMTSILGTVWACVSAGQGRVEIYRKNLGNIHQDGRVVRD